MSIMQITVFGASGKVGSLVVEEALRRGYTVAAFVHSHDPFSASGKLIVVKGDVYNADDVSNALKGSDAVISCLGSWGTPKKNVLSSAMKTVIPAMREQKIKRIVTLTGEGAIAPGQKPNFFEALIIKLISPFPAGEVFQDAIDHMNQLAASNLDWTVVRSPVMNKWGRNRYRLATKPGVPWGTINRLSVVNAVMDQLENEEYIRKSPYLRRSK